MNPDIIPVLIVFGAGTALGAAGTWLAGFARRVRRWRTLCQPPPVPDMPVVLQQRFNHRPRIVSYGGLE
jgi:hypothetical protein